MTNVIANPIKTEIRNGHLWSYGNRLGVLGWYYEHQVGFEAPEQKAAKAVKSDKKPWDPVECVTHYSTADQRMQIAKHSEECTKRADRVPGRQTGRFLRKGGVLVKIDSGRTRMVGGKVVDMHKKA